MLEDDVASNKAIGLYGANYIRDQQKSLEKFSVLTHCNTGRYFLEQKLQSLPSLSIMLYKCLLANNYWTSSLFSLATAGYGTALGVIRALHSAGVLERAYCTETRPFNQVSFFFGILPFPTLYSNYQLFLSLDWNITSFLNVLRPLSLFW